jgi:hypothetical protein
MVNIAHQLVGLLQRIIYRGKAGEACPAQAAEKNILDADFHRSTRTQKKSVPSVLYSPTEMSESVFISVLFFSHAEPGEGVENSKSVQEPQNHDNNYDGIQDLFD